MKKSNENVQWIEKLSELNDLEITKSKLLTAIFMKTVQRVMDRKMQALEANFEEQAEFYGQDLSDYQEIYDEIRAKYEEQLTQIINQYNQLFMNMQLELQEAECNQKIAITNFKKSSDIKTEAKGVSKKQLVKEYQKKMLACLQKKDNYDVIIEECEKELTQCASQAERKLNSLFGDKGSQISLKEEGMFAKFLNKIKNIFTGKTKFHTYCIEPIHVELEMRENKLPDVMKSIYQEMIYFVAKMRQAKEETNAIFENMK